MFGDKLRAARKAAKLTQEELAEKIGVKRSVISKYENGIIDPSISQVQSIADALGTTMLDITDFSELSPSMEASIPLLKTLLDIKMAPPGETTILSDEERASIKNLAMLLEKVPSEIDNSEMLSNKLQHEYEEIFNSLNFHGKALAVSILEVLANDDSLRIK